MRTAIVYDWVNQWGGAERVVLSLSKIYPNSDLYTSIFDPKDGKWAVGHFRKIYSSFLNRLPWAKKKYYLYFPLLPLSFESFDFSSYDLVISVTTFPGKFIITRPPTFHISYCLTPPRFLWERKTLPKRLKRFYPLLFWLRLEDFYSSSRPDYLLATCRNVARRIEKYYRKQVEIVYPGVDLSVFSPAPKVEKEDFFLMVTRLVEYKRIDLAIEAFNVLGVPLKIIGEGRLKAKLEKMSKGNIEFLGRVSERELVGYYQRCQALIYPQEEDFGLAPVEAQACGTPVIAYGKGGVLETVIPKKTGEFFSKQTPDALIEIIKGFDSRRYSLDECVKNAQKFSLEKFMLLFKKKVEERWRIFKKGLML